MNEQKPIGRPPVKPKRTQTGFHINNHFVDKMMKLKIKLGEESLNDTYNRIIEEAFNKYQIR
jgi:hypothetical protein